MSEEIAKPAVKNSKRKYEEWEIRNALEDLERAERIKQNPELMKLVEKEAKKKVADLNRIKWTK